MLAFSRDFNILLRDITDAIAMIEGFIARMDFEEFSADPKTVSAVERKLQVISEAAIRLGSEAEARDSRGLVA